jgi:hypothetical protein
LVRVLLGLLSLASGLRAQATTKGEGMATKTSTKKKSGTTARTKTRSTTKARGAKRTTTKGTGKKAATTASRTVRKAARSPIGKAASKVLAGAAAGAVRAIIPQLEEAADSQEKMADSDRSKGRGKTASAARARD